MGSRDKLISRRLSVVTNFIIAAIGKSAQVTSTQHWHTVSHFRVGTIVAQIHIDIKEIKGLELTLGAFCRHILMMEKRNGESTPSHHGKRLRRGTAKRTSEAMAEATVAAARIRALVVFIIVFRLLFRLATMARMMAATRSNEGAISRLEVLKFGGGSLVKGRLVVGWMARVSNPH